MNCVKSTIAAAGTATVSTDRSCSRSTNGFSECRRMARTTTATLCPIRISESQKGKNPLCGPSGPQRNPSRTASFRTSRPSAVSSEAVTMSAVRIRSLRQQAALRHETFVELLVLLHPPGVLLSAGEGGLERAVLEVLLELGRVVHLAEEGHVPVDGFLRHSRRAEDAAQHLVLDVGAERLLHGGDVLPGRVGNAAGVEHGQRAHPLRLPVADALDGVVDGRVDVLADQVDADLAAALEGDVGELHAQRLLELDGDDLVLLLRAGAAHLHPVVAPGLLLDGVEVFL